MKRTPPVTTRKLNLQGQNELELKRKMVKRYIYCDKKNYFLFYGKINLLIFLFFLDLTVTLRCIAEFKGSFGLSWNNEDGTFYYLTSPEIKHSKKVAAFDMVSTSRGVKIFFFELNSSPPANITKLL